MTEADWMESVEPHQMLESVLATGGDRKLRLFAVACCRRIMRAFTDQIGIEARLDVAERYADGHATASKLRGAQFMYLCGGGASFERFGHEAARDCAGWAAVSARLMCESAARLGMTRPQPPRPGLLSRFRQLFSNPVAPLGANDSPPEYFMELVAQSHLLRDIFGNPFRPASFSPQWRTDTAIALARQMYESRDFSAMPILADALRDAGCDNDDILDHCRDPHATHVRGCWVVDLVLAKE